MANRTGHRVQRRARSRWLLRAIAAGGLAGLAAIAATMLVAQYLYQKPAAETLAAVAAPEIEWQSAKYPSASGVFNILRWAFPAPVVSFGASWMAFQPDGLHWPSKLQRLSPAGAEAPICYDAAGVPLAQRDTRRARLGDICHQPGGQPVRPASTSDELLRALREAEAGTTILVLPGTYRISAHAITLGQPGRPDAPIWLRASRLGTVKLELDTLEGFYVDKPHWVFENLEINGACASHAKCEHAFHIVGAGGRSILRNNTVRNFNATIKGNAGAGKVAPDHVLIEGNRFYNDEPRRTDSSVTLIDVVAASKWVVRRNFIADFAKVGADQTSYGAFFKGAGEGGLFEQNVVMCEWRHRGGTRVGLSLGGGGTVSYACRDGQCRFEHNRGAVSRNIIMNCSDVGIYLNKAKDSLVANNLVARTRGIDARYAATTANIVNNIIDGRILARAGAEIDQQSNLVSWWRAALLRSLSDDLFVRPAQGDFRLRGGKLPEGVPLAEGGDDFCGRPIEPRRPPVGPFVKPEVLPCVAGRS